VTVRLTVSRYWPRGPLSDRASACAPRRRRRRVRLSLAGGARGRLDGALCLSRAVIRPTGPRPAERDVEDRRPAPLVPAARGTSPASSARTDQAGPRGSGAAGGLAHRSHHSSASVATARTQLEPDAARPAAGLAATACEPGPTAATAAEPGSAATAALTAARDRDPTAASCDPNPAATSCVRGSTG
jgi:hypothetical protein